MSNSQVLETIYARVPDADDPTLVAHFHMRNAPPAPGGLPALTPVLPLADGSGRLPNGLASLSGPVPTFPLVPIPVMVPCVLGIQHSVGPVDGECLTDVFGWSFADSTNVVCEFGGQDSPGLYLSSQRVRCVTPGHMSPRFAEVRRPALPPLSRHPPPTHRSVPTPTLVGRHTCRSPKTAAVKTFDCPNCRSASRSRS